MARGLEERDACRDAHVQRLDAACERDPEGVVARAANAWPEAPPLCTEYERRPGGEVGAPDGRLGVRPQPTPTGAAP